MARNWKRACRLTVGGSGSGLDLSAMRIRFHIHQNDIQFPNWADIWVTNLSDQTANLIQQEFTAVQLEAGYLDHMGLIFKGEIIQKRKGREEDVVDTYLNIIARDMDRAYNSAVVNKTLAAGSTFKDQVDACLEPMKQFGLEVGYISELGQQKMPRARVLFGMARDYLRRIAFATDCAWSIQNGTFQMVKNTELMPGEAIVLNSATGLVGMPEQTIDGIKARCLLNPSIRPGRRVQIDQKSVNEAQFSAAYTGEVRNNLIPSLAEDGFYKVIVVEHIGDTRCPPWYTEITCLRADGQGPMPLSLSLAQRGIPILP